MAVYFAVTDQAPLTKAAGGAQIRVEERSIGRIFTTIGLRRIRHFYKLEATLVSRRIE